MTLVEILNKAKEDLHLNRDDLIAESVRTPDLFSEYHKLYRGIRFAKKDLNKQLNILEKDKWEYYSGKAPDEVYRDKPFGHKVKTKEAIQRYVNADEDLLKLREKVEILQEKEDAVKVIMDQINNRSFHINNANKTMEFFHGDQA